MAETLPGKIALEEHFYLPSYEAYGADGVGPADLFGELRIGDRCAARDGSQRAPDFALEWRTGSLHRKGVDGFKFPCEVTAERIR